MRKRIKGGQVVARRSASVLAIVSSLLIAAPALAQATTDATDGDEEQGQQIVVTGQFVDKGAQSATKLAIPVLDTPFSVDSYNSNFLKAVETTNVSDLYRYMTGIQRAGNTGYDITFRGFKTSGNDRNAILTDGLPGLSVRFGSPPTVGVDHIELVKGPTSVLYGQAQPGGFINIITKKPKSTPSFDVTLRGQTGLGSFNRQLGGLASIDFTGPILADGAVSARLLGESGYTRGFRDGAYEKPVFISPMVSWEIDPQTKLTLQGEYRWVKTHLDTYLVAPNRDASRIATINTSYQEDKDFLIERGKTGNLFLEHEFSRDVKFNLGYRYVDHFDTQTNFDVVGFDSTDPLNTITRRARRQENIRTYSFVDANLTAKFDTLGIRHTLLLGFSGGRETASLNRLQFYNCARTTNVATSCTSLNLNIYNPVHNAALDVANFPLFDPAKPSDLNWRYTTQNSLGFYGSDFIEFSDMFKAMVGLRYANERQTIADKRITTFKPVEKKDTKFLPLAGLLFQPVRHVSFYTSYSTSFVPVAASSQDVFGMNPFKPTEATSIEGGVKTELFNRRLNVTAAYFDIKKKNTLNTFNCLTLAQLNAAITAGTYTAPADAPRDTAGNLIPGSGTCSNQLGGERARGMEIELNATPLPNWQITGGYAHTVGRVTSSNIAGQTGALLTNSPRDAINLWTRYDIEEGPLEDLGVGLGVSYIGKRHGLLPTAAVDARPENGTLPLKGYTVVDLGLYYKVGDHLDLTLKASNLFDERYIESAGFTGDIQLVPGTLRTITLTARVHM
ncbi:MAG: TonB-dependent siderophore receptor [Sphingomonadales bacterium]|nr:TonB-dependent siderophore receptor [Sphingomonadales bacterium]